MFQIIVDPMSTIIAEAKILPPRLPWSDAPTPQPTPMPTDNNQTNAFYSGMTKPTPGSRTLFGGTYATLALSTDDGGGNTVAIVLGLLGGLVFVVLAVMAAVYLRQKRNQSDAARHNLSKEDAHALELFGADAVRKGYVDKDVGTCMCFNVAFACDCEHFDVFFFFFFCRSTCTKR